MTRTWRLAVVLAVLAVAGCASSPPSRSDNPQRSQAQCLVDPREGSTRPLFFLFCIQNP